MTENTRGKPASPSVPEAARWDNPEPLPEPAPVVVAAPRKRRWWRR